jgi:periplasmic copper chaperone A
VKTHIALIATAAALVVAPAAAAHVTANPTEAPAGSFAMVAFRVPHGCEDSPTTRLTVRIPDGVVFVTPQAVPGWKVSTKTGELAEPIDVEGETITEGVTEVTWRGGSLSAHEFTDFGISMRLPDQPGETVWFPAVQRCEEGATRWIQIPAEGEPEPDEPAPGVTLTASEGEHGGGAGSQTDETTGSDEPAGAPGPTQAAAASAADGGDGNGLEMLAMGFGAGGLLVGLAALGLTWRRARSS